jgi:DNA-binding transcriptional LysR family regulator
VYRGSDIKQPHLFDKIDLQLIRTLHNLLIERSVSKTAERLGKQQPAVSVALMPCPVPFPKMVYYQLWHERSHGSAVAKWLRERLKISASLLPHPNITT